MTRECDERMWNLAYRLARSGEHQNYQAIEWELRASGFPQARGLLDCERVREKLDGICAEARAIRDQKSPKEQVTGTWPLVSNDSAAPGPTRCEGELQQSPADNDRAL
jgi:hypothetical protein